MGGEDARDRVDRGDEAVGDAPPAHLADEGRHDRVPGAGRDPRMNALVGDQVDAVFGDRHEQQDAGALPGPVQAAQQELLARAPRRARRLDALRHQPHRDRRPLQQQGQDDERGELQHIERAEAVGRIEQPQRAGQDQGDRRGDQQRHDEIGVRARRDHGHELAGGALLGLAHGLGDAAAVGVGQERHRLTSAPTRRRRRTSRRRRKIRRRRRPPQLPPPPPHPPPGRMTGPPQPRRRAPRW